MTQAPHRPPRRRPEAVSKFSSLVCSDTVAAAAIEQRWHWKGVRNTGIWDLDMHPLKDQILTCGGDGRASIWSLVFGSDITQGTCTDFEYVSSLVPSTASNIAGCNAARWSPTGDFIATGNDSGVVSLWRQCSRPAVIYNESHLDREHWKVMRILAMSQTGAANEVTALAWTSDQRHIIGTAMSGVVCVWDAATGTIRQLLNDHTERTCGISVHPIAPDFVTLGDDQRLCSYRMIRGDSRLVRAQGSDMSRGLLEQDKYRAWVRRASWSPDGMFLLVPASFQKLKLENKKKKRNRVLDDSDSEDIPGVRDEGKDLLDGYTDTQGCHIYLKGKYERALGFIPAPAHLTPVCAEFCPRLLRLGGAAEPAAQRLWGELPYRMVFAVAMRHRGSRRNDLMLFDTAHAAPLLEVTNVSMSAVSNIVWTHAGNDLYTASQDGFVSTVHFGDSTLGDPVTEEDGFAFAVDRAMQTAKSEMRKDAGKVVALMKERNRAAQLKKRQRLSVQKAAAGEGGVNSPAGGPAEAPSPTQPVHVLQVKKRKKKPADTQADAASPTPTAASAPAATPAPPPPLPSSPVEQAPPSSPAGPVPGTPKSTGKSEKEEGKKRKRGSKIEFSDSEGEGEGEAPATKRRVSPDSEKRVRSPSPVKAASTPKGKSPRRKATASGSR